MPGQYIFALLVFFLLRLDPCVGLAEKLGSMLQVSTGTWLKSITLKSAQDMNWHDNIDHPEDSGGNVASLAIVFCSDEKLKEVFSAITGPDFFKRKTELKNKYASSVYIVTTEVVPSDTKEFLVKPKDDDLREKIYNNAKFVVAYVSYQSAGDHWMELPMDNINITLRFDKAMMVLEPKEKEK